MRTTSQILSEESRGGSSHHHPHVNHPPSVTDDDSRDLPPTEQKIESKVFLLPPTDDDDSTTNKDLLSLTFDLNQPWQRSLVRELEHIQQQQQQQQQQHEISQQRSQEQESLPLDNNNNNKHARPRSQKILLGRAPSGDYLMEYSEDDDGDRHDDDSGDNLSFLSSSSDVSCGSGSSSRSGQRRQKEQPRPQAIHRNTQPTSETIVALFQGDEDDGNTTIPSTDSSVERKAILDATTLSTTATTSSNKMRWGCLATSGCGGGGSIGRGGIATMRHAVRPSNSDRYDVPNNNKAKHEVRVKLSNQRRASSEGCLGGREASAERDALRSSLLSLQQLPSEANEEETTTTTTVTSAEGDYTAACLCLGGYNLLGYWDKLAKPTTPTGTSTTTRRKKRRTNRHQLVTSQKPSAWVTALLKGNHKSVSTVQSKDRKSF